MPYIKPKGPPINQDPGGGGGVYHKPNTPYWANPKRGNTGLKGYTFAKSAAAANAKWNGGGGGGGTSGSSGSSSSSSSTSTPQPPKSQTRKRTGGAGGGGNNAASSLMAQARRDVRLSMHPILQQFKHQGTQLQQDANQAQQRTQDVYGALGTGLQALGDPYSQAMSGISGNLSTELGGLTGLLNGQIGQAPGTERAAAAGMLGTIGAGGLEQLASGQARNTAYNTSAQRQGVEQSAVSQQNILTDLANAQRSLHTSQTDAMGQMSPLYLQRLDALRQQAAQLALSRSGNKLSWASFNQQNANTNANNGAWATWLKMMGGGN